MLLASIPSPSQGVWHLGPFPLRAYALMIIIGVIVAVWLGDKRWVAKGGEPGTVIDIAVWAVPFGLVGGRLYHVITDYQMYFGEGRDPIDALKIWHGGLGIWGAIALGALGAWIGCRQKGVRLAPLGDAVAPGIALAQAIGRWGNWWNQELYGKPSTLPWAVEIDQAHRPKDSFGVVLPEYADVTTYHPTFLYESLWCAALAFVLIWAGKKWNLNHGRTFALYVAGYTLGRGWIELLRIDNAHEFLGLRLNAYTSLLVFAAAVGYLYLNRNKGAVPERLDDGHSYFPDVDDTADTAEADADPDGDKPLDAADTEPTEDLSAVPPEERARAAEEAAAKAEAERPAKDAETETETGQPEPADESVDADEPVAAEPVEPVADEAKADVPAPAKESAEADAAPDEPSGSTAPADPEPDPEPADADAKADAERADEDEAVKDRA
ncbi:prolipoprotein diacylglyceryl transferase [Actinocorallia sp. A-T 12471]|uniref:prolipoprotein diacylglyceryl transferase n=1 Tax=Actinocorallia sp. A-T 12471 TaxID=3089813 RepID=UPI0029D10632|nr:prolipoprotein diacylglyceryl transferase [Actinocorallia sp. A-T 12471]MDX6743023.1 prolipoprotein diacylglyceryl transferase [Actinocorallia sp. A-T 12471]